MIWLKTLGMALVISGFGSYGLLGARRLKNRVEQLKNLRMSLAMLEKEVTYLHTPLSIALYRTSRSTAAPVRIFFEESARRLQDRQGVSVGEAWESALDKLRSASDLAEDDLQNLRAVSAQLGSSGIEEQKKLFLLLQEQLKIQEENARAALDSGSRLWSYGGFILGATVVLILI